MELVSLVPCHKLTVYSTQVNAEGIRGGMRKNPVVEKGNHQLKSIFKSLAPPFIAALVTFSPVLKPPGAAAVQSGSSILNPTVQKVCTEFPLSNIQRWIQNERLRFITAAAPVIKLQELPHSRKIIPVLSNVNGVIFAQGVDIQRGAKLFSQSCIGCHDGGGNIIQPGATLFLKDLQRNEVDNEDAIYKITYSGKERMPGFGMNCTPRGQCTFGPRLKDDEIKTLAEFVKSQADQGWPDIGIITD